MSAIQVPTCLTGSITSLPKPDICMDGSTHRLHTAVNASVRLQAKYKEVKKVLDGFKDAKVVVLVCGNLEWGTICSYLSVYHASVHTSATTPHAMADLHRVIAKGSGKNYSDCAVVPENAIILAVYRAVHGPATEEECRKWIANNCGK